ncbi:MAG: DUF1611 domain-containing protein [Candidatus Sphingomonas colombiensis]|nr:DUF1611 domain-containing protein [Sphingomonas sp.]WEK42907.1 MAG: DUF1611 domain-containing protein [Sphingomonas sp.]
MAILHQAIEAGTLSLPQPYLLFLGDATERGYVKTGLGLADWAPDRCVGEFVLPECTVSTGLERMTPAEAYARGARALLIGVANVGGVIPDRWIGALVEALEAGLDLISGLHERLADIPVLAKEAARLGRRLIDVRTPPPGIPNGNGRKRSGKRLLTVGTDCALGKKYTALALANGMKARGLSADFRASGQTGIMITGTGVPMDAVVSDFLAGAAELLSPDAADDHWDVVEGQGSLFHPAYAAVSLGLLHGSQPDVFVVCHQAGRETIMGMPQFPLPSIQMVIDQTIALGRLTNPAIRCGGISLNTAALDADAAAAEIAALANSHGLPVADPVRGGAALERLLDSCLA